MEDRSVFERYAIVSRDVASLYFGITIRVEVEFLRMRVKADLGSRIRRECEQD